MTLNFFIGKPDKLYGHILLKLLEVFEGFKTNRIANIADISFF